MLPWSYKRREGVLHGAMNERVLTAEGNAPSRGTLALAPSIDRRVWSDEEIHARTRKHADIDVDKDVDAVDQVVEGVRHATSTVMSREGCTGRSRTQLYRNLRQRYGEQTPVTSTVTFT
eukprot:3342037-Prymnesium_polylepis.1